MVTEEPPAVPEKLLAEQTVPAESTPPVLVVNGVELTTPAG
jgi:hypothetical protein